MIEKAEAGGDADRSHIGFEVRSQILEGEDYQNQQGELRDGAVANPSLDSTQPAGSRGTRPIKD
jgi:hypothetical protein